MIKDKLLLEKTCGIVMPISSIDGCEPSHWSEVKEILYEAIQKSGFVPKLVSDSDDSGIIQKRIVQNLYENELIVCDVSAKNPNVMFELGMRLAFDKPTIIIKDDRTSYSFDTNSIEHLSYPRDLRFSSIVRFKEDLCSKISGTYEKSRNDKDYTTFLKHFGSFTVAKIEKKEVGSDQFFLDAILNLEKKIDRISSKISDNNSISKHLIDSQLGISSLKNDYKTLSEYMSTDDRASLIKQFTVNKLDLGKDSK